MAAVIFKFCFYIPDYSSCYYLNNLCNENGCYFVDSDNSVDNGSDSSDFVDHTGEDPSFDINNERDNI